MSFALSNLRLTQSFSRQALRASRSLSTTASISEPARSSTVASTSRKVEVSKPKGSRQYAVLSEHIGGGDFPVLNTNRFSASEVRDGASYLVEQGLAADGFTYDHRVAWGEVDQVSLESIETPTSFASLSPFRMNFTTDGRFPFLYCFFSILSLHHSYFEIISVPTRQPRPLHWMVRICACLLRGENLWWRSPPR